MDGAEVVQVYVSDPVTTVSKPIKELKQFDKVFVKAKTGEKLDSVGNGNAIEAWCTCLLYK